MVHLLFNHGRIVNFFSFGLILVSLSFGRVEIKTSDSTINLGISSAAWMETGQLERYFGVDGGSKLHQWLQRSFMNITLDATISERIKIAAGLEGQMWLNIPKGGASSQQYYIWRSNSTFIVDKAYGSYSWGDLNIPLLTLTVGRFPFKYNPDVRNLGEYLFRSGTYPAYLINNFDQPFARLTGFRLSNNLLGKIHQDLLLTFETEIPPYYDASLSYIGSCDIGKFLNVGIGGSYAHLISVDEKQTTPELQSTKYFIGSDSGFYTFRGIKFLGRFCFDPKPFIPLTIFGNEDLKIYAEAAILGLKSYPANDTDSPFKTQHKNIWGYDSIMHKIPVLMGINLPTCKVLNVLSVELEWYGSTYPNNFALELGKGNNVSVPLPDYYNRPNNQGYTKEDNWKWSVYAKKMFLKDHLGIIVQCARDHMRMESLLDEAKYSDLEEALGLKSHWWWTTKVSWAF